MIDVHCHLDLYSDPTATARAALKAGVAVVAVTNLPSAFERARPFVSGVARLRLALGLHPLAAEQHAGEWARFKELAAETFYIGEVGLDFSPQGLPTKEAQLHSFRLVLEALGEQPKFITLHSRRAENTVVHLLREARRAPVVLHWYSGPLNVLQDAINDGHYFSINPAMTASTHGRRVIRAIPRDRMLTETDGPFVQVEGRQAVPADVARIEAYLAELWQMPQPEVRTEIRTNLRALLETLRTSPSEH